MSTHKHFNAVAIVAMALAVILTMCCMGGTATGLITTAHAMGYESRLFDTEKVHTIDIEMDDWDTFISTCQSEEYTVCTVIIDGEKYANVGIRGKGNTSLSNVASMDSERYSFKIEFDQYQTGNTYHGLDKLCLNNIIQDNTYMKDYLSYQMMAAFGVDAPLCSFVYITVGGEDWGLYLAVEGIEDSFLQRNYGSDYGELYKPDSMSFGGGRGNGKDFNMEDFDFGASSTDTNTEEQTVQVLPQDTAPSQGDMSSMGDFNPSDLPSLGNFDPTQIGDFDPTEMGDKKGGFGGFGMDSDDVKLQYIDDDPDSYGNIFNNAKTDITDSDKKRLISSLKDLSDYENLENVLDTEEVLRYFVVHNFLVNGDSYTGSMIHNYYLYEENGQLSMIPWDYNLAFGTFQGNDAAGAVNDPIDEVLDDRPMQAWIFSNEEYSQRYHALYQEFLLSVDPESIIDEAYDLIAAYVAKDPTAFCTCEEFEAGVESLRTFCQLRSESAMGQLTGVIPSTQEAQNADSNALIDTGDLDLGTMGTMSNSGGEHGDKRDNTDSSAENPITGGNNGAPQMPENRNGNMMMPQMSGGGSPQMLEGMPPGGAAAQP